MQWSVTLGNSGTGKSTLSRKLGKRLGLQVVHLPPSGKAAIEPDTEQFRSHLREALTTDTWICEANYARRTFDLSLSRADLIICLDTPGRLRNFIDYFSQEHEYQR